MEETTGAPSSFAALSPRRLRASSRDGGGVVNRPPSPLTMLLSRHTRRREVIAIVGGATAWPLAGRAQPAARPQVGVLFPGGAGGVGASHAAVSRRRVFRGRASRIRDIEIVSRVADGNPGRLPALATELVGDRAFAPSSRGEPGGRARGAQRHTPPSRSSRTTSNRTRSRTAGRRASPGPAATSPACSSTSPTSASNACSCCRRWSRGRRSGSCGTRRPARCRSTP